MTGSWSVSLNSVSAASFFEPTGDGVARDAKGTRQAAQTAALMVSTKYALTLLFGVAVGLRVVTAHPPADGAEVALLAILRQAVAGEPV